MMKAGSKLIFLIIPLVALIQILTMPADIAGDGNAIRKVSAWLAQNGEWGIPFEQRPNLGRYLENRNQWFIENDEHQRFYSRWGEVNTMIYAISELLRGGQGFEVTPDQLIYTNILNVVFTALLALYLILIARSLKATPLAAAGVILTCFYATFTWHYLRMQTYEIFQLTFFTAFVFHFFRFMNKNSLAHLSGAMAALFLAAHVKTIFFIFYPVVMIMLWTLKLPRKIKVRGAAIVAGGLGVALGLHLIIATYKMGYFSVSGDAPPPDGWISDFGFKYIPARLWDYFGGIKTSFFLYFPQLAVAAAVWPSFHKKFRNESRFLLGCAAITSLVLFTFCTYGEWCYGPRYWVFLLTPLMIPVLHGLTDKKLRARTAAGLLVLALPMTFLQFHFISRPFFTRQNLNAFLANTEPASPGGHKYLADRHDALVAADLNRFVAGRDDYPLIQDLVAYVPADKKAEVPRELRPMLDQQFQCNFYFNFLCPD